MPAALCQFYSEFDGENTGDFSFFSGCGRKFEKYGGVVLRIFIRFIFTQLLTSSCSTSWK